MSHIYMWFVCKLCSGCFITVSDFLLHKKEKHFAEFQKTKCIVFAEQSEDQDQEHDSDSNHAEVANGFSDLNCDLLTHDTKPKGTNRTIISLGNSDFVNYLDGVKLKVEVDHYRPQPQSEPYVLLKRLTKNQLKTAQAQAPQKLNQSIISYKKIPEPEKVSSPNNDNPQKSVVVKCEPVIFQVNNAHEFSFNASPSNLVVKQEVSHNDEYYEEANDTEFKLTYDLQGPHSCTQFSPASKLALNLEGNEIINHDNVDVDVLNKSSCSSQNKPVSKYLKPAVRPVCDTCSKSFRNKYILNVHAARAHSTVKQFSCKCGKAFKHFGDLKSHTRKTNFRKEKGLKCKIQCLEDFGARKKTRSDLKLEAQIMRKINVRVNVDLLNNSKRSRQKLLKSKHLAPPVRPVCHTCLKSFKNTYILNVHVARAHSTAMKFSCRCGKAFKCFANLGNHQRYHKLNKSLGLSYSAICLEDFAERKKKVKAQCKLKSLSEPIENIPKSIVLLKSTLNLETDKVINTVNVDVLNDPNNCVSQHKPQSKLSTPAVRPVCHTCSKSFKNKYILSVHLARVHSTVTQFSCKCGKAYKCFGDLKSHKRITNLKKEKGLKYNLQCLEDFVERKKKHRKFNNSKNFERSAEELPLTQKDDCLKNSSSGNLNCPQLNYQPLVDGSNLNEAPLSTKSVKLQDVIKLET